MFIVCKPPIFTLCVSILIVLNQSLYQHLPNDNINIIPFCVISKLFIFAFLFHLQVTQEYQRAFYVVAIAIVNTTWAVWILRQRRNRNVHGDVNIALVITITLVIREGKASLAAPFAKKSPKFERKSKKRGKKFGQIYLC